MLEVLAGVHGDSLSQIISLPEGLVAAVGRRDKERGRGV
jgi:hypothetical protein